MAKEVDPSGGRTLGKSTCNSLSYAFVYNKHSGVGTYDCKKHQQSSECYDYQPDLYPQGLSNCSSADDYVIV